MHTQQSIKTIGSNGQISLGKRHAGQQVLVEEEEEAGVWRIRTVDVIPHNERWVHEPRHKKALEAAMAWARENPASGANTDAVLERLGRQAADDE